MSGFEEGKTGATEVSSAVAEASFAAETLTTEKGCVLHAKWRGQTFELEGISPSSSILEVKNMLHGRTKVLPKRQKLVGLNVRGKPAPDECRLEQVKLKNPHKFILVGTPEEDIFVDPTEREDLPNVFDDFDLEVSHFSQEWINANENSANLKKIANRTEMHFINPPREGKFLLVLDLDHTLLDFSSTAARQATNASLRDAGGINRMKRPHMDAFLASVYSYYDICVWSQTSWRWLELKLTELGFLSNPNYRICTVLDKTSMFPVTSTVAGGQQRRHHVKPLKIIWDKHARWHAGNTIHVDDLACNFALNPKCGMKVKAYRRTKPWADADDELVHAAKYLVLMATAAAREGGGGGWRDRDHGKWREALEDLGS